MTDLNIKISDAINGDPLGQLSIHRGGSLSVLQMAKSIRDALHVQFNTDHFVHLIAQEELSRIAVPGGWLYSHVGDKRMVYVPDDRNKGSYLGVTVEKIHVGKEEVI